MTDDIARKIYNYIDRFIACDDASKVKAALRVLHAHLIASTTLSPFLFIKSPQKRCGKSHLLTLLALLCPNPREYASPSAAALYTTITLDNKEGKPPTLVLDEMDRVYERKDTADITAFLDANCERGKTIPSSLLKNLW